MTTYDARSRPCRSRIGLLLTLCAGLLAPAAARAGMLCYDIRIDTTLLIGHPAGPFSIDFQLNDGSGTNDGNNTATLSSFNFAVGGSAGGSPMNVGGAMGSLAGVVTITDSQFLNEFTETFTPGTALTFNLMITTNVDPGPQPDEFTMFFLDSTGVALPTVDPVTGRNAVIVLDLTATPTLLVYGGDGTMAPNAGGPPIAFGTPTAIQCPEPGSIALLALGGLAAASRWRWSRRRELTP